MPPKKKSPAKSGSKSPKSKKGEADAAGAEGGADLSSVAKAKKGVAAAKGLARSKSPKGGKRGADKTPARPRLELDYSLLRSPHLENEIKRELASLSSDQHGPNGTAPPHRGPSWKESTRYESVTPLREHDSVTPLGTVLSWMDCDRRGASVSTTTAGHRGTSDFQTFLLFCRPGTVLEFAWNRERECSRAKMLDRNSYELRRGLEKPADSSTFASRAPSLLARPL